MHHLLRQLLARIQAAILLRPRRVLAGSAALLLAALLLGSGVEFRNSRSELAPPEDPDQLRWSALLEEYGASEALIACVEAEVPGRDRLGDLRSFTDRLAAELGHEPLIDQVFHKFDVEWVFLRAFHLMPPETLRRIVEGLRAESGLLEELGGVTNLAELNRLLAGRIAAGFESGAVPSKEAEVVAGALAGLLRAQHAFLRDPSGFLAGPGRSALAGLVPGLAAARSDGYLKSNDGTTFFIVIVPRDADDGLEGRRALLRAARARAERVQRLRPGFQVAFTGSPAMVVEEMDTVRADTWRTTAVAVLGVSLLTFLVFRWRSHALIVLACLAVGVVWAFGAVRLELGYLNLITSSFISTLVGVGVAYGIHPVSEYELQGAHTADPAVVLRESFHRTGVGVTVAAVTTAAAFFSILLMRFRGFAELGLVAGVGVLLCLLAATVTLPALLMVYARRRRERDREKPYRPPPVMDWFWVEKLSGRVCLYPRTVTVVALLVTGLAAWAASGIGFDTNIFDLLPREAESLRYQRRLALESDLSPLHNIVVAQDLDDLARMAERAAAEPAILRFESVARFLPSGGAESAGFLEELRVEARRIVAPPGDTPLGREDLAEALGELEEALALAGEAAFVAGMAELAGPLEEARGEAERSIEAVAAADPALVEDWNRGQQRIFRWARGGVDWLHAALATEPPTLETLPAELRERFLTRSGRPLGFLYPAGSVFDPDELERFVAASRRVAPEATGFPVVFSRMSRRITSGFYRAVAVGALLVALILLVDFRQPRDALLAMAPLAMGIVWMLGGMRLAGIPFNFANLVAVPLIIGVGIDNGVHVIHRVRFEGRQGMNVVLRHTGRAILIASLTTMIGFGSLALASHRGLASLGLVLLLGVGSCLVTATWVLPNLLVVLRLVDR